MVDCIEDAGIAICMAGLLTALATTQLSTRLTRENACSPRTTTMKKLAEGGDQCILRPQLRHATATARRAGRLQERDRPYLPPEAYFRKKSARAARQLNCFWPDRKPEEQAEAPFRGLASDDWTQLFRLLKAAPLSSTLA